MDGLAEAKAQIAMLELVKIEANPVLEWRNIEAFDDTYHSHYLVSPEISYTPFTHYCGYRHIFMDKHQVNKMHTRLYRGIFI